MTEQHKPQETQLTGEQLLHTGSEFLNHFAVEANPIENPDEFRDALKQLDPRYQGGRDLVRWELESDQTEWDETTKNTIMRTAENMRMLEGETPLQGDFDVVIVLGGARQSNLDRTRHAVNAINEGTASVKQLVIAGSSRELNEAEQENTANYAPGAKTEFDLCVGAAATVAKENPSLTVSVQCIEDKKAGTPDIINNVLTSLEQSGNLEIGANIAAVTTQIYQASTELDLARVSRNFGAAQTFTAGNPSDPNVIANRKPATYLTEVLRTLRAAVNDTEASAIETAEANPIDTNSRLESKRPWSGLSDMVMLDETRPSFGSGDWGDEEELPKPQNRLPRDTVKEGLGKNINSSPSVDDQSDK